jgi:hypothetical protein
VDATRTVFVPDSAVNVSVASMELLRGQIANLGAGGRLSIPIDLLRLVEWWEDAPVDVMAELSRAGLVRIFLASEANALIQVLMDEISEQPNDTQFEALSIVADRYRPLKLYSDGRLRLTKETCSILDTVLGQQGAFFVQPFRRHLEILTLGFRAERLAATTLTTSIKISS